MYLMKMETHFLLRDSRRKRKGYKMEDDMRVDNRPNEKVKEFEHKIIKIKM